MNKALKTALSRRIVRVSVLAASCAFIVPAQDSTTVAMPEETVKLSAKGSFLTEQAAVGDTVVYQLLVEWRDSRIPVVVLAPESLETPGFRIVDQSATHRKTAENGEFKNATEFTYKLMARVAGSAKVNSLKLRYLTGFSNREEVLYVPATFIDVGPAHIALWNRLWFQILLGIALLAGLIWGGRGALKKYRSLSLSKRQAQKQRDFTPEVQSLKGRWNTADSRVWIQDVEKICIDYLRHNLGKQAPETARFEILLDTNLARNSNLDARETEGWNKLRELFHQARYAGGRKEPHELQETYRILKTCLHIQGENE